MGWTSVEPVVESNQDKQVKESEMHYKPFPGSPGEFPMQDSSDRIGIRKEESEAIWRDFYRYEPVDTGLDYCCQIFIDVPYIEIEVRMGGFLRIEVFSVDRCPKCGRWLKDIRKLKGK